MDIDFYNILNLESTYYLQHYYKQALKHGLFTWNWYTCPHSAKIFIDRQFDGYLLTDISVGDGFADKWPNVRWRERVIYINVKIGEHHCQ